MIARVAAVVLLVAASRGAWATEPPEVYHVDDPSQFGRPSRIVEPQYPKEALARHITGYIDVRGHISPLHVFADAEFMPGKPEAFTFVQPLKDAFKYWEFYPVLRDDCFPSDEIVNMRVIFDIQDDKPKVSVLVEPSGPPGRQIEVVSRTMPRYPRNSLRDSVEANIYSRSTIARDGSVSRVETKAYPERFPGARTLMEEEVKRSLGAWKYVVLPEGDASERIVCQEVIFQLR